MNVAFRAGDIASLAALQAAMGFLIQYLRGASVKFNTGAAGFVALLCSAAAAAIVYAPDMRTVAFFTFVGLPTVLGGLALADASSRVVPGAVPVNKEEK